MKPQSVSEHPVQGEGESNEMRAWLQRRPRAVLPTEAGKEAALENVKQGFLLEVL